MKFGPEYGRVVAERGDQRAAKRSWPIAVSESASSRFGRSILAPAALSGAMGRGPALLRRYSRWVPLVKPMSLCSESCTTAAIRSMRTSSSGQRRLRGASGGIGKGRAAHGISIRARNGQASTEQFVAAVVHFRALFDGAPARCPVRSGRRVLPPPRSSAR